MEELLKDSLVRKYLIAFQFDNTISTLLHKILLYINFAKLISAIVFSLDNVLTFLESFRKFRTREERSSRNKIVSFKNSISL